MTRTLLALSITAALVLTTPASAQDHDDRDTELDRIVVTATPLRQESDEVVRPVEVLAGTDLDDAREATLGETVSTLPGVQSSFFGPGVGRPIIRGLDGPRVQVLNEGLGTLDVSTISVDHAVTIEPFLADQIEVLKGPSTLLFGSGAIGGAVNVVDGRIHEQRMDGISGRTEIRGNTGADERAGMARIDAGAGGFVFHADGFHRETGDYDIPGFAEIDADHAPGDDDDHDEDEVASGRLANSATRSQGGAAGISYIGDRGFAGVALSRYETRYGVPGHGHGHHEEHAGGHEDENGDDAEEPVVIDMAQTRIDAKAGLTRPFAGHDALRVRLAHNNYRHVELEGSEIGTRFDNDGLESRIELVHAPITGWHGAYGLQYSRRDFQATGEEAFVPPSESDDLGLFAIERREWDGYAVEAGGRYDRQRVDPDSALPTRDFSAFSASAAGEWRFRDDWQLRLGLDRAQRSPTAEELYSDGLHVATASYEIGDAALDRETSNQVELGLHYHGDALAFELSTYVNRFDDFIYLSPTGEEIDEAPVLAWTQRDARFRGAEAEMELRLADNASGRYQLRVLADSVRAELADGGGNLPRIAPGRHGAGLDWSLGSWRAGASAIRYRSQDRVATGETPTAGYTLVDVDVAYAFDMGDAELEVFAQGRNLTDQEARLHTSFLKDVAPLPGRSFGFGVRAFF